MQLADADLLRTQAYVNGEWIDADDGETTSIINPANGNSIAQVARCGTVETQRAITAAARAQEEWRGRTAKDRAQFLRRWFDLMMLHQDDLAVIMTAEQGKPLAESRGEIAYGASFVEWFGEEAKRIYGDTIPGPSADRRIVCIKQPVGVVACITPWNFPNAMLTRKIAPALATGCTVVCKPANSTPLSALAIAVLAERADIPPGVINIVMGKTSEIGAEMTNNPIVRKLTFTGSTEVGKQLIQACAGTAMVSKYRNAGQTCVCSNRILVQSGIYDAFAAKLAEAVAQLKVGDGADEGTTIGPLIDLQAANSVLSMIDDAVSSGAKLITGGKRAANGECFVEPTVLTNVTPSMRVFREEIFGPVAPLMAFETEAEAIELANDTEFGLAAYFYTRDIGRIWRVAEGIDYGIVGINEGIISNEMAPFGGMKESGGGREGSKYGMDEYLEIKYLCMGGIDS